MDIQEEGQPAIMFLHDPDGHAMVCGVADQPETWVRMPWGVTIPGAAEVRAQAFRQRTWRSWWSSPTRTVLTATGSSMRGMTTLTSVSFRANREQGPPNNGLELTSVRGQAARRLAAQPGVLRARLGAGANVRTARTGGWRSILV